MSVNVGTANAINVLLQYLMPSAVRGSGREAISKGEAQAAAAHLAIIANHRLMAGITPQDIARAWAKDRPGPQRQKAQSRGRGPK